MSKVFNVRTGLIVMFSLLMVSYGVLVVFYINSLYNATVATPQAPVDIIVRTPYDDGSTIKVPPVVTSGVPFIYETRGDKLVDTGGTVLFQMTCKTAENTEQITPLGSVYSNLKKGKFDIRRTYTIASSTRLQPSESCKLQTITKYTFYSKDRDGSQGSFDVTELGESNSFKLVDPDEK
jgi:hypothetical protein